LDILTTIFNNKERQENRFLLGLLMLCFLSKNNMLFTETGLWTQPKRRLYLKLTFFQQAEDAHLMLLCLRAKEQLIFHKAVFKNVIPKCSETR